MSKLEIKVVLGFAFGDEGKGNTVQWLCKKALKEGKRPIVARFSGGPQAGHRIILNGKEHVCSSFGAGSLLNIPTVWIGGYIDPISMVMEYRELKSLGCNIDFPFIEGFVKIITPYDIILGRKDRKILSDGTCGKGLYPTFRRYNDWKDENFPKDAKDYIERVRNYYGVEKVPEWEKIFIAAMNTVKNRCGLIYNDDTYDEIIFEGSQGLLLDMDNGFMPNCTPSHTGLNGVPKEYINKNTDVYLVTRAYLTRHGNGYIPRHSDMVSKAFNLDEPTNVDTGYQGKFKRGILDLDMLNRAIDRHHLDNYDCKFHVVINHFDTLVGNLIPLISWDELRLLSKSDCIEAMYRNLRLGIQVGNIHALSINSKEIKI